MYSHPFGTLPRIRGTGIAAGLILLLAASSARAQAGSGDVADNQPPPADGKSLGPEPRLPAPEEVLFVADPVADGAVLSLALGLAGLSEAIINTGEISPQQPNPNASFLFIDRDVLCELSTQGACIDDAPQPAWGTVSNVGLGLALLFSALDPIATGVRKNPQAALVDAVIYAESISITWALTNVAKIGVRRPRPSAYAEQARLNEICAGQDPATCTPPSISATNSTLSFPSGHASITASVFATGTYLAFTRESGRFRPWIVMGIGAVTTTLVDIGRVYAGKHFPTDVIAGSMVGIGIGIIVPHLHRSDPLARRPVWVGFEPYPGGGTLTLNGYSFP